MKRIVAMIPVTASMIAMTVASSMPTMQPPPLGFQWSDKFWHGCAFFVFGCFVHLACQHGLHVGRVASLVSVVLWSASFAAADEWHQTMVPGRTGDVGDWLADTSGALVAAALLWLRSAQSFRTPR